LARRKAYPAYSGVIAQARRAGLDRIRAQGGLHARRYGCGGDPVY